MTPHFVDLTLICHSKCHVWVICPLGKIHTLYATESVLKIGHMIVPLRPEGHRISAKRQY
jgi:hypothetical protein